MLSGGIPWWYQVGGRGLNKPLICLRFRVALGLPLGRANNYSNLEVCSHPLTLFAFKANIGPIWNLYIGLRRALSSLYAPIHNSAARNGGSHAGCDFPGRRIGVLRHRYRIRPDLRETLMSGDYILAACVTLGVLGYLVYALIRPERF